MTDKTLKKLYIAVNEMLAELVLVGEINTRHELVSNVMDALYDIDGGKYKPDIDLGTDKHTLLNSAIERNTKLKAALEYAIEEADMGGSRELPDWIEKLI